ncbi:glycosyltransferase [Pseudomonas sp. D1-3]
MSAPEQPWVLQICHGYDGPFLDCARQYAVLFKGMPYKVCTVYLSGAPSAEVERGSASDEVVFLDYSSAQLRGLKLGAIAALKRVAASRNFDLCIAHRFKPIYVALLGTCLPVVGVHHAFGVYSRRARRLFINRFRRRLLLLGVSNAVRDEMRRHLPNWPTERIETLYNRIDLDAVQAEQVSRGEAREHLKLPENAWIVGNVGRLHPDKDQVTLLRGFAQALPQLPDASLLVIMGNGRLEGALKTLAHELGIAGSVRFLGQVTHGRRYFKAFDVFALASDHEPFGMVLLEAMAAGVPLICTACGGGREVVEGVGQLFELGDAQGLADELLQSTVMQTETEKMRTRLQQLFSDQAAVSRFQALSAVLSEA